MLGDVEPAVVHLFGYFNPGMIEKLWNGGRENCASRRSRDNAQCPRSWPYILPTLTGLKSMSLRYKRFDAVDDSSFALFAGLKAEPVPSDAPAAAFHQAMVLRNFEAARTTAIAAVGLPSVTAHAIKRPNDVATLAGQRVKSMNRPPTLQSAIGPKR